MNFNLEFKKRLYTSMLLISLLAFSYQSNMIFVFLLIITFNFAILEFSQIIKKITKNLIARLTLNIIFVIYFFILGCIIVILIVNPLAKIVVFYIISISILSDVGGYLFGKLLKGPKLTKISPNKTISGSLGSFVLPILFLLLFFENNFIFNSTFYNLAVIIVISLFTQLGDIFFSYLKRISKIKDTGNILPGHGGVLDRIDGILLGIPSALVFIILVST